eukprot:3769709-Pyramimonas_sp.AAC.1
MSRVARVAQVAQVFSLPGASLSTPGVLGRRSRGQRGLRALRSASGCGRDTRKWGRRVGHSTAPITWLTPAPRHTVHRWLCSRRARSDGKDVACSYEQEEKGRRREPKPLRVHSLIPVFTTVHSLPPAFTTDFCASMEREPTRT